MKLLVIKRLLLIKSPQCNLKMKTMKLYYNINYFTSEDNTYL